MSALIQKARKERVCRRCGATIQCGMLVLYAGVGTYKVTICEECVGKIYVEISTKNKKLLENTSS